MPELISTPYLNICEKLPGILGAFFKYQWFRKVICPFHVTIRQNSCVHGITKEIKWPFVDIPFYTKTAKG
jgi:hypothetical protein